MTAARAARSVSRSCGREERQRLGVVLDLAADRDQDGLVVADQADDVLAGDVGGGDDDDLRPVERRVEVERDEAGVGVGRADRRAEPRTGKDEVVGVLRLAGQLGGALAAERGGAAGAAGGDRAGGDDERLGAPSGSARQGWSGWAGSGSSSTLGPSSSADDTKAPPCRPADRCRRWRAEGSGPDLRLVRLVRIREVRHRAIR